MALRDEHIDVDALSRHAHRLQSALDGAGQGVWDHNIETGETYFSDTWKQMRGYHPHEDVDCIAGPWLDRLHPDDKPRILDMIRRQDSGELQTNAFEYRERNRDGHWIWILSRGRPVEWTADGRVARIVGTDTDVSALKAAEQALAEERERLLVTLRSVAEGLVSVDAAGTIVNFNTAADSIIGWAADEPIGRPIADVLDMRSGANLPITRALVSQAFSLKAGAILSDDILLVRRDGSRCRAHCSLSPIFIRSRPAGLVIVFRDTSQEHEFRERLRHAATHDPLTHLPNRSAFSDAIEMAVATAEREMRSHVLCFVDLDRFKAINDGAGHAAGDEVLRAVAICLARNCRAGDMVARLGGDEFALILVDTDVVSAERICDRITNALRALDFVFDDKRYQIGASIGLQAIAGPAKGISELMLAADKACYEAKSRGKGRWASAEIQQALGSCDLA